MSVVGGGFIGLSSALSLVKSGHQVQLIDRSDPGHRGSTSFGIAGAFAHYEMLPLNRPKMPAAIPGLLSEGTVGIKLNSHFITKTVWWGAEFLRNCCPGKSKHTTDALSTLVTNSAPYWERVLNQIPNKEEYTGTIELGHATSKRMWPSLMSDTKLRQARGAQTSIIESPSEMQRWEPIIAASSLVHGFVSYGGSWHFKNPGGLLEEMCRLFKSQGGTLIKKEVNSIEKNSIRMTDGTEESFDECILAAGTFSQKILRNMSERHIPLDTERGYHIVFTDIAPENQLKRSVGWLPGKLFLTPVHNGIRVAGLSELGGYEAPPTPQKWDLLEDLARKLIPSLPPRNQSLDWIGYRPSLPDQLPVIGRSTINNNVIHAFGHGHLGATLGPITGELVTQIVNDTETDINMEPFSPRRFC